MGGIERCGGRQRAGEAAERGEGRGVAAGIAADEGDHLLDGVGLGEEVCVGGAEGRRFRAVAASTATSAEPGSSRASSSSRASHSGGTLPLATPRSRMSAPVMAPALGSLEAVRGAMLERCCRSGGREESVFGVEIVGAVLERAVAALHAG